MDIVESAKILKLSYVMNNYKEEIKEAKHTKKDYGEFLKDLFNKELENRRINGISRRISQAKFPCKMYLEDFEKMYYSKDLIDELENLETLDFMKNKENVILIGTPGAGKTHYATALGIKACIEGKKVLFAHVPNLVIELREALSQSSFNIYKRKFNKYDLVILDELGYVTFDKPSCEILFNLLSERTNNGSIIITSNLTFDRWQEVFNDPMLTGALVDRMAYKPPF